MNSQNPSFNFQDTIAKNRLLGLWRMMKGYRLVYLVALVSLAVATLAKTGSYLLFRFLIDDVLAKSRFDAVLVYIGLGFVGLALVEGGFSFIGGVLSARTAEGTTRRLRNYLFDHIQRLTYAYHAKTPTGELIERCTSDVDALRRFFADQVINIGRIGLMFTINFVTLLQLNVNLALISIIVLPFVFLASVFFFKRVSKAYESYQEQEAILSTTLQENLTGVRVVKAFSRQDYEIGKFDKDNREKYQRGIKLLKLHSLFWPVTDTLCGVQILCGMLFAATLVMNGQFSIGSYVAYTGLVVQLIFPIRNLGRLIVQMSSGLVSYTRVIDVIKEEREPLTSGDFEPENGVRGEIAFDNVFFEYEKGNPVLKGVSFHGKPGSAIALLGSTGSGKTTLVNLLPRFYDITSGEILCDGVDIRRYSRKTLRQHIGIVEQEPFLFSRTIEENITYGVDRKLTRAEVEGAARAAAIHDTIMTFPDNYATLVGEKGVTLSGGQKQRVAIARTLLKNPRILILDDSTSSVDTETEAAIREALNTLMQNRTTFIIAHRIQSIMNADLILVFDKGHIIQSGTHAELMATDGMYRQIYDIQTRIDTEVEKEISSVAN